MAPLSNNWLSSLANRVGGMFSKFENLLKILFCYLLLCIAFWVMIWQANFPDTSFDRTGFIAYEIATGGDPFNFETILKRNSLVWTSALVMHVLSWLIVPVLIAGVVDAAYRSFELARFDQEKVLKAQLRTVGSIRGYKGIELDEFVEASYRQLLTGEKPEPP